MEGGWNVMDSEASPNRTHADMDFCTQLADRLGMTSTGVAECLIGEPIEVCEKLAKAVETEEARLRADHGFRWTYKNYSTYRALKKMARDQRLGAFRGDVPTQGIQLKGERPGTPEERPARKREKERRRRRQV